MIIISKCADFQFILQLCNLRIFAIWNQNYITIVRFYEQCLDYYKKWMSIYVRQTGYSFAFSLPSQNKVGRRKGWSNRKTCFPQISLVVPKWEISLQYMYCLPEKEGIPTLRTYKYWIIYHTVIETCFELLKSSEHEKLWGYSSNKTPNFFRLFCSFLTGPPITICYPFRTLSIPWIWLFTCLKKWWFG